MKADGFPRRCTAINCLMKEACSIMAWFPSGGGLRSGNGKRDRRDDDLVGAVRRFSEKGLVGLPTTLRSGRR